MKMSDMVRPEQKRQHPFMIVLEAVNNVKYAIVPLLLMVIANLTEGQYLRTLFMALSLLAVYLFFSLVYQVFHWGFYTYRLEESYLHIKAGVIFKKERSVKRERVQTVNIRTGIIQRWLGLATLEVETAGGGNESELSLTAVAHDEARRIKEELERDETSICSPKVEKASWQEDSANEYRLSHPELFLAGATSGGFLVLFSLIIAAFSQLYPLVPDAFWEYLLEQVTSTTTSMVILVVITLLLLSWLISTVSFMIRYANFTLRRHGDYLQLSWGLIEQKQLALKLHRLQALNVQEEILRQPLGRCTLTVEVAGGGSRDENYVTMLFPLIRYSKLQDFLARIIPEYRMPQTLKPLPIRSRRRYLFRAIAPVLILILTLQLLPWPYLWVASILLVPAFILGLSRYYAGGAALDETQLTFRYRNLSRYTVFMQRYHVQSLQVNSNPFQRWRGLRSLRASVLSSPHGKSFQVTDVDAREADRVWKWFSRHKRED